MRIVFVIRYYADGTFLESYEFIRLKLPIWYKKMERWQNKRIV